MCNNFNPSAIANFIGEPTQEKKSIFKKLIESAFTGAKNAGKILINYVAKPEYVPIIQSFQGNNIVDQYMNLSHESQSKIVTAHGIPSSSLIGGSDQSSNIFANPDELTNMMKVFNATTIKSYQKMIEKTVNIILMKAGFPNEDYKIKQFVIDGQNEQTNVEVVDQAPTQSTEV